MSNEEYEKMMELSERPKDRFAFGRRPKRFRPEDDFYCRYCNCVVYGRRKNREHKGIGPAGPSPLHIVLKAKAMQQLFDIVRENGF